MIRNSNNPTRFGFLLLDNFTLISLSAAIEPLRMANRILGEKYYDWNSISCTSNPVVASDGLKVNVDYGIDDISLEKSVDIIIVCGGIDIESCSNKKLLRRLRRFDNAGMALGAICTGSCILADAGLLDGYQCSVHWENLTTLRETHAEASVNPHLFSIDRNRYTSSGGTAPMDMMLHLISQQLGSEIASGVAEQFICHRIRRSDDIQRIPLWHMLGGRSGKLIAVVQIMEANMEEPLSQQELAGYVGLSLRQLERLFKKYLFCTPSHYYLQLRLQRARDLLQQTNLNILEISILSGFISTSHFSKSYKEFFGYSPSLERTQVVDRKNCYL